MTATVTESILERPANALHWITLSDNSREELEIMKRVIRSTLGGKVLAVLEIVVKRELEKRKAERQR